MEILKIDVQENGSIDADESATPFRDIHLKISGRSFLYNKEHELSAVVNDETKQILVRNIEQGLVVSQKSD